jgi:hypothetical protein
MKMIAGAGCFAVAVALWMASPVARGISQQAPQGTTTGLPPVDYSLGPDSQERPGVPKGTVTRQTLAPGKFFPGTPHNYQVYVPAQYEATRPLPYMIFLDGSGYAGNGVRVPVVLDNLIARKELPAMSAIFIDPGVMPALSDQAQNRYERIFEYDSLTPRFANFLIEELVPEVAKSYNLSRDPNDHGIAGISTGGVGAFVAAWNRPDQFRRVITWVGSFGNFRGADRLPGLIRRTEPRPIRVFMQTGRQDLDNYAGSWYLENPRMAAALEFAGNDVRIELGEDGHSNRHGASMLPDTLRWLWRDYPRPVSVGEPEPGAGRGFSGVGGLTVDSIGYMWATSAVGIQVCEQPGRCSNILNKPEFNATPVSSIAFGGPGRAWLYVTQGGKIFRRETKRIGVVAWEPVKPPQPGL